MDNNGQREVITRAADDIFRSTASAANLAPVPKGGALARAIFDLQFADSDKPRPVEVRPPNIVKFGRRCDAQLVQRWLSRRGFRTRVDP